ncbi:MAG: helix-turn-helix transcriptional regulator [Paludibacteraceae bacterium]|nr:helix-turn-helix transcriptional regulator [Paludibacteraceae bacterium]
MTLRGYYHEYKSEFIFGILLLAAVVASYYFSQFIPTQLYLDVISPFFSAALLVTCGLGAWLLMKHSEGLRVRKLTAYALMAWTVLLLIGTGFKIFTYGEPEVYRGFLTPSSLEFVLANVLGWLLMVYLAEALRPGWLNFKRACVQLLPVLVLGVVDAFLPNVDLRWLLAAYPLVLLAMIGSYVRDYRRYMEDNYGSMENIDVQWIVRYIIMLLIAGGSLCFLFYAKYPTRLFTQQWFLFFMIAYSTDRIIFRPNPWGDEENETKPDAVPSMEPSPESVSDNAAQKDDAPAPDSSSYAEALEQWMQTEKPYLNKDFRLTDLQRILPLNRTYLSQLINSAFGCTFYQYVTNYRIEEAKRLMREQPELKIQEIADRCGFSSPTVFGRTFARETGMTPTEWNAQFPS